MENSTEIYDMLKILELEIDEKVFMFGQYVFVKHDEIYNIIDKIINTLPEHIKIHKIELYKAGYGKVFDCLDNMENILGRGYRVFRFTLINATDLHNLINNIYAELPSMFQFAKKYVNS